jgi:hypothetical protein
MKMTDTILTRQLLAVKEGICPICGSLLRESESVKGIERIFTWFECTNKNCDWQWIQKKHIVKEMAGKR